MNTVKPDLVLFVGEALVGHDAVDQLTQFNKNLIDLSKEKEPRMIDGIILTKFDTIDDKVRTLQMFPCVCRLGQLSRWCILQGSQLYSWEQDSITRI